MNLKKAIAEYLMNDPSLQPLIDTRVYRKKAPSNTSIPFVVYDITGYQNRLGKFQWKHGYQGNKLTIDIVCNYEQEDMLQALAQGIIVALSGFVGQLTPDRTGTIGLEGLDEGYDPETNYSIVRLFFLCKHTF